MLSYDLTDYTGKRKNVDRKDIVANYSVSYRDMTIALAACGISLPLVLFGVMLLGMWGLIVFPIAVVGAFWLLGTQGGDKLQTKRYQALDNAIGARGGRRLFSFMPGAGIGGDRRGIEQREGVILVSGMPLVAPDIVEVIPAVIPNPHRHDVDIARASRIAPAASGESAARRPEGAGLSALLEGPAA